MAELGYKDETGGKRAKSGCKGEEDVDLGQASDVSDKNKSNIGLKGLLLTIESNVCSFLTFPPTMSRGMMERTRSIIPLLRPQIAKKGNIKLGLESP